MRTALVLLAASFLGASLNVWCLSGVVPWFLLPDFPFLAAVYAGLFIPGPLGFLAAAAAGLVRETTASAPPGVLFLSSLFMYLLAREISLRLFVRAEFFVLTTTILLLAVESVTLLFLSLAAGSGSFGFLWGIKEVIRIAWTSLIAVPLFMDLSGRWQKVTE